MRLSSDLIVAGSVMGMISPPVMQLLARSPVIHASIWFASEHGRRAARVSSATDVTGGLTTAFSCQLKGTKVLGEPPLIQIASFGSGSRGGPIGLLGNLPSSNHKLQILTLTHPPGISFASLRPISPYQMQKSILSPPLQTVNL